MIKKFCLIGGLAFATIALAQIALPPGAALVSSDPLPAFELRAAPRHETDAKLEVVPVQGPGFDHALRIDTLAEVEPPRAIAVRATNSRPVKKGDVGLIRFYARTLASSDETGLARVEVSVRKNGSDAASSFNVGLNVSRDWQEFVFPFAFRDDYEVGGASFAFNVGFKKQSLEIGGIELIDYEKTKTVAELPRTHLTYVGEEDNAAWRQAALARIETLRKGDLNFHVLTADGQAAPGANVEITERRSFFQWGSALQYERLVQDTPDNEIYREKVLELFNEASPENDLKWPVWLGERKGGYSHTDAIAALHWLNDHHFYTRGHVLVWPGWKNLPHALQELKGTPEEKDIPGRVTAHIHEMADATRGLLREWDVLNEPFTNHDLMDLFGSDIMVNWFVEARNAMGPDVKLFFNDFSNHDQTTDPAHVAHYEKTIAFLQSRHAPVDGLGIQAHFGAQPNAPENILATFDRYQKFGLPLRITEFDVNTDDEDLQAKFTRDFLIVAFSHPSVIGVQYWGFWANAHWRPDAAMFRSDWSEKPNAKVYRSLVLEQWRTHVGGKTDATGSITTRAFYGDYDVTVKLGDQTFSKTLSLTPDDPTMNIEVRLP